ncbi:unnamed protein product [Clonostachys byssicola]|uniref:Phytanoyl-CoA dioxygenase n=1 Tax=Clonostachys byssicola TaxID=160290 RepID=A0A9N9UID4_9HYPO|nr:unnamed protein product [Clonostachys byssicola]
MSLRRIPASSGAEKILEAFREDGGVIIQGFLEPQILAKFNAELDPALRELSGGETGDFGDSVYVNDLLGRQTKRRTDTANISKTFREDIADNELLHELCEVAFSAQSALGTGYWFNTAQVIEIGPGSKAQPLHRDQEIWACFNELGPTAPEATVNFLMALTPFTEENGATRVVPGSHLWPKFEPAVDDAGVANLRHESVAAEMDAGDVLFFSGKTVHGGGANRTLGESRRGFALSVIRQGLAPEQAHAMLMPVEVADTLSYRAQAMFGFRSLWPPANGSTVGAHWTMNFRELGRSIGLKDKPFYPQKSVASVH